MLEIGALSVELHEELLSMGSGLSARPGLHVLLHFLPVLSVQLESLEESYVFRFVPAPVVKVLRVISGG